MSTDNKLGIWSSRLRKEFDGLEERLPPGVTHLSHAMDEQLGTCVAQFRVVVGNSETVDEAVDAIDSRQEVIVELKFDHSRSRYPFEPPLVRVVRGVENLPGADIKGDNILLLPDFDGWTPSQSVITILQSVKEVMAGGQAKALGDDRGGMTEAFVAGQQINLDLYEGRIFPCRLRVPVTAADLSSRYLGVTATSVLELEAHNTRMNMVVVKRAEPLLQIQKLKFKRGLSVTILYKDRSIWELETEESSECVGAIQEQLRRMGIQGKRTSMSALNEMEKARHIIDMIQAKEKELVLNPSVERVQQIMDMYMKAIEKLGAVSDEQHPEVVGMMHTFLQRPDVQAILDPAAPPAAGRSRRPSLPKMNLSWLPKGEILQRSEADLNSEDDDGLAREERRLPQVGAALKKMLDVLGTGGRTPRLPQDEPSPYGLSQSGDRTPTLLGVPPPRSAPSLAPADGVEDLKDIFKSAEEELNRLSASSKADAQEGKEGHYAVPVPRSLQTAQESSGASEEVEI